MKNIQGDEGKLLVGETGAGLPWEEKTRTVIPTWDSHLHIAQPWRNSCLPWIILFGDAKKIQFNAFPTLCVVTK